MTQATLKKDLEKLEDFKKWISKNRKGIKERAGQRVYSLYITQYMDDMLECVEAHIEDLASEILAEQDYE